MGITSEVLYQLRLLGRRRHPRLSGPTQARWLDPEQDGPATAPLRNLDVVIDVTLMLVMSTERGSQQRAALPLTERKT